MARIDLNRLCCNIAELLNSYQKPRYKGDKQITSLGALHSLEASQLKYYCLHILFE